MISSPKGRSRGIEGLRSGDDSFCAWVEGVTSGAVTVTQRRAGSGLVDLSIISKSVNDTTHELKPDDNDGPFFFLLKRCTVAK